MKSNLLEGSVTNQIADQNVLSSRLSMLTNLPETSLWRSVFDRVITDRRTDITRNSGLVFKQKDLRYTNYNVDLTSDNDVYYDGVNSAKLTRISVDSSRIILTFDRNFVIPSSSRWTIVVQDAANVTNEYHFDRNQIVNRELVINSSTPFPFATDHTTVPFNFAIVDRWNRDIGRPNRSNTNRSFIRVNGDLQLGEAISSILSMKHNIPNLIKQNIISSKLSLTHNLAQTVVPTISIFDSSISLTNTQNAVSARVVDTYYDTSRQYVNFRVSAGESINAGFITSGRMVLGPAPKQGFFNGGSFTNIETFGANQFRMNFNFHPSNTSVQTFLNDRANYRLILKDGDTQFIFSLSSYNSNLRQFQFFGSDATAAVTFILNHNSASNSFNVAIVDTRSSNLDLENLAVYSVSS